MTKQNYSSLIKSYSRNYLLPTIAVTSVAVVLACIMYQCSENVDLKQIKHGLENKIKGDKK